MENINIKKCTCCGCNILWETSKSDDSTEYILDNSAFCSIIVKPEIKFENEKTTILSVICDKCGFKNAIILRKSDVPLIK